MAAEHDYEHAIWEIRRLLHIGKAAVMIGAGFSRNAPHRTNSTQHLPDWAGLSHVLASRLYPDDRDRNTVLANAGATSSATRLAQEFQVAFGRVALADLVRDTVRDEEYIAGDLHQMLLTLPWSDVFTTNYDRLLEFARPKVLARNYEVVRGISDLPMARRPRIVKLHGTLPDLENLIISEDDYRTYPKRYAPFVATVEAALTENILCLVGFSGLDPNFLAWTGWLRDEMQTSVPNTYFFAGDDLKPFQRQLLEERHVISIPLKRIADVDNWEDAFRWLFRELSKRSTPAVPRWNLTPDEPTSASDENIANEPLSPSRTDVVDAAIMWRANRHRFKGWYVMHREGVGRLDSYTNFWRREFTPAAIESFSPQTALFIVHEFVWRWTTALQPLDDLLVFEVLDPTLARYRQARPTWSDKPIMIRSDPDKVELAPSELDDAYEFLIRQLFRHAREIGDDKRFRQLEELLQDCSSAHPPARISEIVCFSWHERTLRALGRLEISEAIQLLRTWDSQESDPIWQVRRAALCFECGLIDLGVRLLHETLQTLRSIPITSEPDIALMSVEGIVLNLLLLQKKVEDLSHASGIAEPPPRSETVSEKEVPEPQGFKKSPPLSTSSATENAMPPPPNAPDEAVMIERLYKLRNFGCDTGELRDWLEIATTTPSCAPFKTESGFDIGSVIRNVSIGSDVLLKHAYRALRFIEDAAIPMKIQLGVTLATIGKKLLTNALRVVRSISPHEAVGIVLRARDEKLAKEIISRECLASLSDSQISMLDNSGRTALREALAHFDAGALPNVSCDGDLRTEQFTVACAVLSHVIVRLTDDKIEGLADDVLQLPNDEKLLCRPRCHDELSHCVRRIVETMGRHSIEKMLPTLLCLPVYGSPEFPAQCLRAIEWYDPIAGVASFSWTPDSPLANRCNVPISRMLERIVCSKAEERVNLCLRATYLLQAGLLSKTHKSNFVESLFSLKDDVGLPTQTGCLDVLMLSLPHRKRFNELAAFRAKHIKNEIAHVNWRELRRSSIPLCPSVRAIKWTKNDLNRILELARTWLSQERIGQMNRQSSGSPLAGLHEMQTKRLRTQFLDWLGTLENLILLSSTSSEEQRIAANALVIQAKEHGLCITQSNAARVYSRLITLQEAVDDIRERLADRDHFVVRQACDAILLWHDLAANKQMPQAPGDLADMLVSLIAQRRHEFLPLVISTSIGVVERLRSGLRSQFLQGICPSLKALLLETSYDNAAFNSPYSIGEKLVLRTACGRLARVANTLGFRNPAIVEWQKAIRNDLFADVRRQLF